MTVEAAQRDFANVLPRVVEVSPMVAPGVPMQMLLDQGKPIPKLIPLRDDIVGDISRTLWMVAATAVLVLLVTCANVANLLLVRADGRHRELSVRAALGAGRRRVLAHFFTESAVLAGVSALLGLGVAAIGIRLLVDAGPTEIPRLGEVQIDAAVVAFTVVVARSSRSRAARFRRFDSCGPTRCRGCATADAAARSAASDSARAACSSLDRWRSRSSCSRRRDLLAPQLPATARRASGLQSRRRRDALALASVDSLSGRFGRRALLRAAHRARGAIARRDRRSG